MRNRALAVVALVFSCHDAGAQPPDVPTPEILGFEVSSAAGRPRGWLAEPPETVAVDRTVVHGGQQSARIERAVGSVGDQTTLRLEFVLPPSATDRTLALKVFVRAEGIDGAAALMLTAASAGRSKPVISAIESDEISGDVPWREVALQLSLPQSKHAGSVSVVGLAGLSGHGKFWIDDVQFLIDGQPIQDAKPLTVNDTDREFDGGSGLKAFTPTQQQVAHLVLLGKVWGFLKYHHPEVTRGRKQWDYELFRVLPQVLAAEDVQTVQRLLSRWVDSLGPLEPCASCATPADDAATYLEAPLTWLDDESLRGSGLGRKLRHIHERRSGAMVQFYLSPAWLGNATFDHELSYEGLQFPDAGYQLLTLFRFWNIIAYWFPYRNVMDEDWDAVLAESIPSVLAAHDKRSLERALIKVVARVHDGHVNMFNSLAARPPEGNCRLPVTMRFIGSSAFVAAVDAPADSVPTLERGDEVLAIDGHSVASLVADWTPYYAASNEAARLRDIAASLPRGACEDAVVSVKREGHEQAVHATRQVRTSSQARVTHDLPGPAFRLLGSGVAYLKLSSIAARDIPRYLREADGTRGLIVDIRNLPAEYVVYELGRHLVATETTFARVIKPDPANPGRFVWAPPLSLQPAGPRYAGRVVILVDELSWSQSEFTAMALRVAPGARVVGSTTAGSDGDVSPVRLPFGLTTQISGKGYFLADGTPTQRVGIVPDLAVHPTRDGLRTGRDEVLAAAIREIVGPSLSAAEIQALATPQLVGNP